jgi:hypothetical protein
MFPNDYKTYLTREVTTNGLSNAFFNGLACWYLMKDKGDLIWWGAHSFGVDVLATAFILPWIVALIIIPLQNMKVRKGKASRWSPAQRSDHFMYRLAARFPQKLWLNAILFGLIGMVFIAPLVLLVLFVAGADTLTPEQYTYIKGAWTGTLAAILTTPMILVGLREYSTNEVNS